MNCETSSLYNFTNYSWFQLRKSTTTFFFSFKKNKTSLTVFLCFCFYLVFDHEDIGKTNGCSWNFCQMLYADCCCFVDKKTITGKRKDYWEYFCDCLAPLKGLNDGIKYVKTTGDVSLCCFLSLKKFSTTTNPFLPFYWF